MPVAVNLRIRAAVNLSVFPVMGLACGPGVTGMVSGQKALSARSYSALYPIRLDPILVGNINCRIASKTVVN